MSRVQKYRGRKTVIPLWLQTETRRIRDQNQHNTDNALTIGGPSRTCTAREDTGRSERCTICLKTINVKDKVMHYAAHKGPLRRKLDISLQKREEISIKWQQFVKQVIEIKKRRQKNKQRLLQIRRQFQLVNDALVQQ